MSIPIVFFDDSEAKRVEEVVPVPGKPAKLGQDVQDTAMSEQVLQLAIPIKPDARAPCHLPAWLKVISPKGSCVHV